MQQSFVITNYNKEKRLLTVQLKEDLNIERLKTMYSNDLRAVLGVLKLPDPRRFSEAQRLLYWALLGDIHRWSGTSTSQLNDYFKEEYVIQYFTEISVADNSDASVAEVNNLIEMVLDFMFEWNVPFPRSYEILPKHEQFYHYQCCKHRKCVICGQSGADIHHLEAVGNRKRSQVDHRKFPLTALCRKHHNEAHNMGVTQFMNKYQIHPIYLNSADLIRIGVMNMNQIRSFDDRYKQERGTHE
ncbi:hypothetical protein IGI47_000012 [Enterococcus sp. AZ191]|uniref:putative HNHc nuclease n=1 Tax=Enterococcus TaxID=1350 RepID=UPI001431605F|nr:putative HNHc nuclease [Enterococcus durans]NJE65236.1 DUF968 domain-containing protein [Enterococcus durans]